MLAPVYEEKQHSSQGLKCHQIFCRLAKSELMSHASLRSQKMGTLDKEMNLNIVIFYEWVQTNCALCKTGLFTFFLLLTL